MNSFHENKSGSHCLQLRDPNQYLIYCWMEKASHKAVWRKTEDWVHVQHPAPTLNIWKWQKWYILKEINIVKQNQKRQSPVDPELWAICERRKTNVTGKTKEAKPWITQVGTIKRCKRWRPVGGGGVGSSEIIWTGHQREPRRLLWRTKQGQLCEKSLDRRAKGSWKARNSPALRVGLYLVEDNL